MKTLTKQDIVRCNLDGAVSVDKLREVLRDVLSELDDRRYTANYPIEAIYQETIDLIKKRFWVLLDEGTMTSRQKSPLEIHNEYMNWINEWWDAFIEYEIRVFERLEKYNQKEIPEIEEQIYADFHKMGLNT